MKGNVKGLRLLKFEAGLYAKRFGGYDKALQRVLVLLELDFKICLYIIYSRCNLRPILLEAKL